MSQSVVGLDLGSYSLKWVEFSRDFRQVRFQQALEARIPLDPKVPREEAQSIVLAERFGEAHLRKKMIVTGYPGHQAAIRILNMPSKDRNTLEKMVPFELENHLPMELDEIVYDWEFLADTPISTSVKSIIATAVFQNRFENYLNFLKRADIDPRDVTLDCYSLGFLFHPSSPLVSSFSLPSCFALIDCGYDKTNVCIVSDGKVAYARTIGVAGKAMTQNLEKDFGLRFLEAETLKQTDGQIILNAGSDRNTEADRMSKSILRAVDELASELRQTFTSCEELTGLTVQQVHFMGGSARLKNLAAYLSKMTEKPFERPNYFSSLGIVDFTDEEALSLNPALALCFRGCFGKVGRDLNLRKGNYRSAQSHASSNTWMSQVLVGVGVCLLVLISAFVGKWMLLQKQIKSVEKEIQTVVQKVSPNYKMRSPRDAVSVLQQKLSGSENNPTPLSKIAEGKSPLLFLHQFSVAFDKQMPLTLTDLNIDSQNIRLEGTTDSRETIAKIRDILVNSGDFPKVSDPTIEKSGEGFQFGMSLSLVHEKERGR